MLLYLSGLDPTYFCEFLACLCLPASGFAVIVDGQESPLLWMRFGKNDLLDIDIKICLFLDFLLEILFQIFLVCRPAARKCPRQLLDMRIVLPLADDNLPVKLALSLHAPTQDLRKKLMPSAGKWKFDELIESIEYYYRKTKTPVTFEYILFEGLNDRPEDIKRLAKLAKRVPAKINLIPFHTIEFTNPTGFASELKPASKGKIQWFRKELLKLDVQSFQRTSSGLDIDAACGQLALKSLRENKQ